MLLLYFIIFVGVVSSEPPSNRRFRPEYTNYADNSHENIQEDLTPPLPTYNNQEYPSEQEKPPENIEENKKDLPDREGHLQSVPDGFLDEDVADNPSNRDWQDEVPGTAGKDYPNLKDIPETSFSCADKVPGGYYADVETGCQVFHVCNTGGVKSSFLCPPGSIFNQKYFVCDWWYDFECDSAPELYSLNKQVDLKVPEKSRDNNPPDQYQSFGNSISDTGDLSLAGTGHSRYQETTENFNGDAGKFDQDFQADETPRSEEYRGKITVNYWPPQNDGQDKINHGNEQSPDPATKKQDNVPRGFSFNLPEVPEKSQGEIRYSENSNRAPKKLFDNDKEYLSPPKPGNEFSSSSGEDDYENEEEKEPGKSSDGNFGQKFLPKPTTSYLEPPSVDEQQRNFNNVVNNDHQVPLIKDEKDQRAEKPDFPSRKSIGQRIPSGKSEPSVLSRRDFPESKVPGIYIEPIDTDTRVLVSGASPKSNEGSGNNHRTSEKDLIYERPPLPPLPAFPVPYIDFARKQNRGGLRNGFPGANKNLPGSEVVAGTTTIISPSAQENEEYSTTQRIFTTTTAAGRDYSSSVARTFGGEHDSVNHSSDKFIPGEGESQGQREQHDRFPDNANRNAGEGKGNRFHQQSDSYHFDNVNRAATSNNPANHFPTFDSFNEDAEERYLPGL